MTQLWADKDKHMLLVSFDMVEGLGIFKNVEIFCNSSDMVMEEAVRRVVCFRPLENAVSWGPSVTQW